MNDDSLLQEDIPQCISDLLSPIPSIAFQPLGDCEKTYYYALAKKGYSNNSSFLILSQYLQRGNTEEHKKTNQKIPKKSTIDAPKSESFPLTEEMQKK